MTDDTPPRRGKARHEPPNWGDPAALARRIKTANVIAENKEGIGNLMLNMAGCVLTDYATWDASGRVTVKPADEIPVNKLYGLKKIKQSVNKDGVSTLEIEMFDKVQIVRVLAKAAGYMEPQTDEDDRPSILGINIKAPVED